MNEFFWIIFELGISLMQSVLFAYFLCGCLKYKGTKKTRFIPFVLCTLLVFGSVLLCNSVAFFEGMASFIYSLIVFVCAVIFFKGPICKKIFVALVPNNAISIGSVLIVNFISYILNKPIYEFLAQSSVTRIITVLMANLVFFLILFIIKKITEKRSLNLNNSEWLLLSISILLSTVSYVLISYAILQSQSYLVNFFCALSAAFVILINIIMYLLLAKYSQRNVLETENKLLKQHAEMQAETMRETKVQYNELRKARHDFNNTLKVIRSLGEAKGSDEITAYIDEYLDKQSSGIRFVETGNAYIDAVLNNKIAEAEKNDVSVFLTTINNFGDDINIELCSIISNMFDNAITASKDSRKKMIHLDIFEFNKGLTVRMKNSIDKSVLETNPNLVTSKPDKEKHGYGTRIIRDTAETVGGFADFYEEDGNFVCNVVLFNVFKDI